MILRQVVLNFLFDYCVVQILNIATGRPIQRLANWIAMYGEPERDQWQPTKYVEGGWK